MVITFGGKFVSLKREMIGNETFYTLVANALHIGKPLMLVFSCGDSCHLADAEN